MSGLFQGIGHFLHFGFACCCCRGIAAFAAIKKMKMRIVGDGWYDAGHQGGFLVMHAEVNVAVLFGFEQKVFNIA